MAAHKKCKYCGKNMPRDGACSYCVAKLKLIRKIQKTVRMAKEKTVEEQKQIKKTRTGDNICQYCGAEIPNYKNVKTHKSCKCVCGRCVKKEELLPAFKNARDDVRSLLGLERML